MEGDRARRLPDPAGRSVLSGARVKRLHPAQFVSPALIAETPGARLQLMCRKCMIPRDLDVSRSPKLKRRWTVDLEEVFAHVTFRCRCGMHAHALRVTRPTRDSSEVLLLVQTRHSING